MEISPRRSRTYIMSASSLTSMGPAQIRGTKGKSTEGPRTWRRRRTNAFGSYSRLQKEEHMPRGKNRVWLKLDKTSKVSVRAGSTNVEIRLTVPAERIRKQLDRLKSK